ncbi:hypothetical protein K458DRAFT_382511 [Lentithecium fluviatile CBS 122367]|uniref:Uncharacterized protein n=1 Tax=Lentithecium fluviatile CBS 122367 TaxID=1168545 RepID=A0A6G1JK53_9PLEO|nr:hypothetical protein K458DRAFT_382511 [Lentithecium fluviatile CBS 122367]
MPPSQFSPSPHVQSQPRPSTYLFYTIYILHSLSFTTPTPPRLRSNVLIACPDLSRARRQMEQKAQHDHPGSRDVTREMSKVGIAPENMVAWLVVEEMGKVHEGEGMGEGGEYEYGM